MKKIILIATLIGGTVLNGQTVSNDFESGDRSIDQGNCWGFGGFSIKTNDKINGSYSARSGSINNTNGSFWLHSPWINLTSGNITFETKLNNNDGTRDYYVEISFIPYDANAAWGQGTPLATTYTHTYTLPHSSSETVSYPVPSAIADDGNPYLVRLSFYNQSGNRNRRAVVDDWFIPGTYASDPANSCLPLVTVADTDGDGVDDDSDQYPNDPDRVFTYSSPEGGFGSFAFEDLWPAQGDYDFNDFVVDFRVFFTFNADNEINDITGQWYVRAVGGVLTRGLGVHFPGVSPSDVQSVTGQQVSGTRANLAANGTELGQSSAVIVFFDEISDVINWAGGTFYNTVNGEPVGQSDTIDFEVVFSNPITMAELQGADIFIFLKDRGDEIHLPDRAPTDLANLNKLGTGDDDSDPAIGRYYKTTNNYPWGMELPSKFDYPAEKTDIVQSYLKFASWAQSGGNNFSDWYEDQSGYRDLTKLFQ